MALDVVDAEKRVTTDERIVNLGCAYPDAIDIRTALPCGYSHVSVRGTPSQTSGAQPRHTPDPGLTNEQTASNP